MRQIWASLGIGCGVYFLYTAWTTWQNLEVLSDAHRLLNIGLMLAFAYVGAECFRRAKGKRDSG